MEVALLFVVAPKTLPMPAGLICGLPLVLPMPGYARPAGLFPAMPLGSAETGVVTLRLSISFVILLDVALAPSRDRFEPIIVGVVAARGGPGRECLAAPTMHAATGSPRSAFPRTAPAPGELLPGLAASS